MSENLQTFIENVRNSEGSILRKLGILENPKKFIPKDGDIYFYINFDNVIKTSIWENSIYDDWNLRYLRACATKKEAERRVKYEIRKKELRSYDEKEAILILIQEFGADWIQAWDYGIYH